MPVLGAISDAQESLQQAIAELWPNIPHQLCQYHVLREASRPIYEQDRKLKVEMRKPIQDRVRKVRKQLEHQRQAARGQKQNS
jgi:transposase-like protein